MCERCQRSKRLHWLGQKLCYRHKPYRYQYHPQAFRTLIIKALKRRQGNPADKATEGSPIKTTDGAAAQQQAVNGQAR